MAYSYSTKLSIALAEHPEKCRCVEVVATPGAMLHGGPSHEVYADPFCAFCDGSGLVRRETVTLQIAKDKIGKRLDKIAADMKHTHVTREIELVKKLLDEVT